MGSNFEGLSAELIGLGFSGLLLNRLLAYIVDGETLKKFQSLVELNELCGGETSRPELVHDFVIKMQFEKSYQSANAFLTQFNESETADSKSLVIAKLFAQPASSHILKKVVTIFEANHNDLEALYHKVVKYRCKYKPDEILTLLEIMPN